MLRSMFSAISGLRAHQTKMDTVANNIANVNTVGYKTSNTVFETTLTQVLRSGKSPDGLEGGANPAQVGLGVKLAAITTDFGQGKTQNTGRALDFMIQGDGFFVTESKGQQLFTRAGSFTFDGAGKLITADGAVLQGWKADPATGAVSTSGPLQPLAVSYGSVKSPNQTATATIAGSLALPPTAAGATENPSVTTATMFDAQGAEHQVTYTFTRDATNSQVFTVGIAVDGTPLPAAAYTPAQVTFANNGTVAGVSGSTDKSLSFTAPWVGGGAVTSDLAALAHVNGGSPLNVADQDGYTAGSLQSFALNEDGTIMGVYSNGERQAIGKLALATFNNPSGLVNMGNTSFAVGDNSGVALIGAAGEGSLGTLASGALEMSNVDLSEEFTGLIIAQRGFQANSRVISASDELLQDLVNLKR